MTLRSAPKLCNLYLLKKNSDLPGQVRSGIIYIYTMCLPVISIYSINMKVCHLSLCSLIFDNFRFCGIVLSKSVAVQRLPSASLSQVHVIVSILSTPFGLWAQDDNILCLCSLEFEAGGLEKYV